MIINQTELSIILLFLAAATAGSCACLVLIMVMVYDLRSDIRTAIELLRGFRSTLTVDVRGMMVKKECEKKEHQEIGLSPS